MGVKQPEVKVTPTGVVETTAPKKTSKWWPLSFFILWVFFTALGAGLIGSSVKNMTYSCTDYDYALGCTYSNGGPMFYGGVACCVIGGLLGLCFWIVLAVFIIKRLRARRSQVIYINNSAPQPQQQQVYQTTYPAHALTPVPTHV